MKYAKGSGHENNACKKYKERSGKSYAQYVQDDETMSDDDKAYSLDCYYGRSMGITVDRISDGQYKWKEFKV